MTPVLGDDLVRTMDRLMASNAEVQIVIFDTPQRRVEASHRFEHEALVHDRRVHCDEVSPYERPVSVVLGRRNRVLPEGWPVEPDESVPARDEGALAMVG